MFSLRDYLISIAENAGSTISYDEKWVHDTIQRVHGAMQTWAKGMKIRDILFAMKISL